MSNSKIISTPIDPAAKDLLAAVHRTRALPVLSALTKAAIFQRDSLLGKDPAEPDFKLHKVSDAKSRRRLEAMLESIRGLDDRKAVSMLCAACINQRKTVRALAKAEAEAEAEAKQESAA